MEIGDPWVLVRDQNRPLCNLLHILHTVYDFYSKGSQQIQRFQSGRNWCVIWIDYWRDNSFGLLLVILTPVADVLLTSRMDVREDVKKAKQRLEKTQWELKDYAQQAKVMVDDLTQEKRKLEKISEVIFGFSQFYTKGKSLDERIQTLEKQLGVDEHTPTMAHFGSTKREMERIKRYLKEVYRKVLGQEPPWL